MLPTPDYTKFTDDRSIIVETAAFLLHQRYRSVDKTNSYCMYRGPNGLKCAVGYWIPDEDYKESLEKKSIGQLASYSNFADPELFKFFRRYVDTFSILQKVHDYVSLWMPSIITKIIEYGFFVEDAQALKNDIQARMKEMDIADPIDTIDEKRAYFIL